jgi:hypothetical protein
METKTIIIHGYSDCSESFVHLKRLLINSGIGAVETVLYADYESREDNLTFNDIADGLNELFIAKGFISRAGDPQVELHVIVHSTGGLVIRHWISAYYADRPEKCPVKRIVMLAPANFGSPLAHRGKSFLGSLVKGRWKVGDLLEVGRNLLNGLELASPFQWDLAHRDLLQPKPYFSPDAIQTTVLVGAEDYTGIHGWVNKPGTDGTVVIAGTPLNTAKVRLDFCTADGSPYAWTYTQAPNAFAFGVLEDLDHGSIVERLSHPGAEISKLLLEALKTTDFKAFQAQLEELTARTYRHTKEAKYQQFIVHCTDDLNAAVGDYTLEFFVFKARNAVKNSVVRRKQLTEAEERETEKLNKVMLSEIHTNSVDSSYRRLLVNLEDVKARLRAAKAKLGGEVVFSMRVHVPPVERGILYDQSCLQNVVIHDPTDPEKGKRPAFFFENTTTLLEMKVNRQNEYVFLETTPRKH